MSATAGIAGQASDIFTTPESMGFYAERIGREYRAWLANTDTPGLEPDPLEIRDFSNECEHECLPHDKVKPPECKCWSGDTPDLMGELANSRRRSNRARTSLARMVDPGE